MYTAIKLIMTENWNHINRNNYELHGISLLIFSYCYKKLFMSNIM